MEQTAIPKDLAALPQWVCFRFEPDKKTDKLKKVPINPHTGYKSSTTNPATWGTLEEALAGMEKYQLSGIGFVFTAESGIVGIDLDHCILNGKLSEQAADIMERLPPTYAETSPSGTGLHTFVKGKLPGKGNKNDTLGVEMYASGRYFTVTGNRWNNAPLEIADDNGALEYIYLKYIKPKSGENAPKSCVSSGKSTLSDEDLLLKAAESKDAAAFQALWNGKLPDGKTASDADFALCMKLAFWSNRDFEQIDRLFRQSKLMREKWDEQHGEATYGELTIKNACAVVKKTYAPPKASKESGKTSESAPLSVFERNGCYFRTTGEHTKAITNFIVLPIGIIRSEEEAILECELISDCGKRNKYSFVSRDFSNVRRFKDALNHNTISFCFFGTDSDVEALKQYIDKFTWREKRGVKAAGMYLHREKMTFVTTEKAVIAGGAEVDTIIQLEKYLNIDSDLLSCSFLTQEQLLSLGKLLLSYNEYTRTVPILAWVAACFIKPFLRRAKAKFPHLFLIGESGGGKSTTLEKVILPIFGLSKTTGASLCKTFTLMSESASSNVIPQAIDEFKPSTLRTKQGILHSLYNHFRESYDGQKGVRGKPDQSHVDYHLLAPIVVAGEESAEEPAIRERTVEVLFSQKALEDKGRFWCMKQLISQPQLLGAFGRSLLDCALSCTTQEVSRWYNEGLERFSDEGFSNRIGANLACLYAGLLLINKLCGYYGLGWNAVFPHAPEDCFDSLAFCVREYLLGGNKHNKSVLEEAFEVMSRMRLKVNQHYRFLDNGKQLALWLAQVYDLYTKYHKDYNLSGELLSANQFQRQLKLSDCFIEANKGIRLGENTRKCWVIDFEKLAAKCDVSGFTDISADQLEQ